MARYQLPQFRSTYKDPQSVEINKELHARYVDGFAADDSLTAAVDAMDSTDFEGDVAAMERFKEEYNAKIKSRATDGDYENMSMNIARDARSFVQDYSPIQQNKADYDANKAELKKARDAYNGKGKGIDEETYQLKLNQARYNNAAGLQYDQDGELIKDSRYKSVSFVGDIDFDQAIDKGMKGIKPHEWSQVTEEPVHSYLNDKGELDIVRGVDENGKITMWATTKTGSKAIPASVVQAVIDDVFNDPNSKAALNQKASLRTLGWEKEGSGSDGVISKNEEYVTEYVAQLDEQIAELQKKGPSEELDAALESKQNLIDSVNQAGVDAVAEAIVSHEIVSETSNNAKIKYVRNNTESSTTFKNDTAYLKGLKKGEDTGYEVVFHTPVLQTESTISKADGKNSTEKNINYTNEKKGENEGIINTFNNQFEVLGDDGEVVAKAGQYTEQDLLDMSVDLESGKVTLNGEEVEIASSTVINNQNAIKENKRLIQYAEQQLEEAKKTVDYVGIREESIKGVTVESVGFDLDDPSNVLRSVPELYTRHELEYGYTNMLEFYTLLKTDEEFQKVINEGLGMKTDVNGVQYDDLNGNVSRMIQGKEPEGGPATYVDNKGKTKDYLYSINKLGNKTKTFGDYSTIVEAIESEAKGVKEADKALNEHLKDKQEKFKTSGTTHRWPGRTVQEAKNHKKTMLDALKVVPKEFAIYKDGKREIASTQGLGMTDTKVTDVSYMPDPVTGELLYVLTISGKRDKGKKKGVVDVTETIFMDADQMKTVTSDGGKALIDMTKNSQAFVIEHRASQAEFDFRLDNTEIAVYITDSEGNDSDLKLKYNFIDKKVDILLSNGDIARDSRGNPLTGMAIGSKEYHDFINNPNLKVR